MGTPRGFESTDSSERQSVQFATRALSAEHRFGLNVWSKYKSIFDLIDRGARNLLIRSCNGAGKSTLLATIATQDITRYDNINIVMTGANQQQLQNTLWRQTKRLAKLAGIDTAEFYNTQWEPMPDRRMIALAPSKTESAQGFHAERVDIFVDEATSMDSERITGLFSNATGEDTLKILTYNPISTDTVAYDLEQSAVPFEHLGDTIDPGQWISIGISAFEHPNVISGHETVKGAVTRGYIEDLLRVNSTECQWEFPDAIQLPWCHRAYLPTPEALARVLGKWSEQQSQGFISGSVVVAAWSTDERPGARVAGADIGAGGDPSVWTHFNGNSQQPFEEIKTSELGVVADKLHNYCLSYNIDAIGIDDTGVGHGVTDRLQERKGPYKVIPINFASAPKLFPEVAIRNPMNARCEMYLILEKQMRAKQLRIRYDKELQRELTSIKIAGHKSERMKLEDKVFTKRRLGRSPNKADATAIAVYAGRLLQYYNRPLIY